MIVIPMAGLSQRFADAGYRLPKYMLDLHGRSVFAHSVGSFAAYARVLPFLFILRDVAGSADFVRGQCEALGISETHIVKLDGPTRGQAETVALGVERAGVPEDEPLTVFNIDTFRPGFRFPSAFDVSQVDGYLEVFRGEGANWSYVEPVSNGSDRVARTTEKVPISDLCCTGLYHVRQAGAYLDAYRHFAEGGATKLGLRELYLAPMYNLLIEQGADIRFHEIPRRDVVFCGVPVEYEALLHAPPG